MPRYFAFVPAAGSGVRLGEKTPKQYAILAGHPLVSYALRRLAAHPLIEQVFVVLAPGDTRFRANACADVSPKIVPLYCGGETRAASVFNGLMAVNNAIAEDDWVLVHDAARPALSAGALQRLIDEIGSDDSGGLLAIPVADTLKRADAASRVTRTEPRENLWQAQTPQMFRYALLVQALSRARLNAVTDESAAVEALGVQPKLVQGEARNLKVTYPEDLELASLILELESKLQMETTLMAGPDAA